jgi:tight adherence protein B
MSNQIRFRAIGEAAASALVALGLAFSLSSSISISLAFATISIAIPYLVNQHRLEKRDRIWNGLWPEVLEHIVSGLQSGLSIEEALSALGRRGPSEMIFVFQAFDQALRSGANFELAIGGVKREFAHHVADQVCEVLILSKGSGARDTATTLRTLSDYLRADMALRDEITAKQSWVKNSAIIASIAPWILLLILSTQTNTIRAYQSAAGISILIAGLGCTVIAYFWMRRVGRIQIPPRVFRA